MPSPLVGVTTRSTFSDLYQIPMVSAPRSYCEALVRAGALPVLIPLNLSQTAVRELQARLDGVLFTGGGDIETARFNGADHAEVYDVDPERDRIELDLVKDTTAGETPFLGICRGLQVLNVAFGGTLHTHIADQLPGALQHSYFPGHPWDYLAHPVRVGEGSRLAEIVGEPILQVNSLHHQGVKEVAGALKPVAYAPDGLVEALELPGHRFGLAVQWHPEWLVDDPAMQAIFNAFVAACGE
ncbi:MAG: gamma-glutamyl-gamma-aminobutyrate hydrolase family protein [Chloroflexi bacterium]|nr:gamma-glutamyl-gamma-aminobutyrate hydrolase family protein [Chloroflexota bacterium]